VRKIKSYFFISLDGVVESPDKWYFPYLDDEMGAAVGAGFAGADASWSGTVWRGSSSGRAEHPAGATQRANLQDRRAESQLRPGEGLTDGRQHGSLCPRSDRSTA
jgi:hypothetical protein